MANSNSVDIGFEKQIWDAACVLWGHIPATEYRKVIIGLIFLRYISNAFEKKYEQLVAEGVLSQMRLTHMLPNKAGVVEATSLPSAVQTQAYCKEDILVSNIRPYLKNMVGKEWRGMFK